VGQASTLSVSADISGGTGPFSYQWMEQIPGGSSYSVIGSEASSAESYNFVTSGSTATGIWSFELVVTDGTGVYVTSNIVTVTVTVDGALTVSVSPSSWTMDVGQSTTFTATASGGSGSYTSYQWYVNGLLAQSGAASVMPFTPVSSGSYLITVTVTDSLGATSAQSSAASVTVAASPTVSIAPVGPLTLDVGQSTTFTATSTGGLGTINYQWYLGGSAVSGATGSTYSFSGSVGSYSVTCKVTDSASTPVTSPASNAVTITVNQLSITVTQGANGVIAPGTSSVNYGGDQTFTITPNTGYSIASLTVDGSPVTTASSYTFSNVQTSHTITATFAPTSTPTATPTPTPTATLMPTSSPTPAVTVTPTPSQTTALAAMGQYLLVIAAAIILGAVIIGVFIRRRKHSSITVLN
jgi:hypothetical protein